MFVLVIGATGMLGAPVAEALRSAGHSVRVMSRDPQRARARLGEAFTYIAGDVEDAASLDAALTDCDAVHINLNGGADLDLERRGVQHIVHAARKAGVQRVSYISGAPAITLEAWLQQV
ncbi:MAG: SDR family oxidoreductase [Chloroflexaceae bacterium]